jgi:hypothetical protein
MALTFTPSTIATPNAPSYAAPQTPAVSGNALTMLGELANIDLSQQQLKKAQATFGSDVSKAQSDAETAAINARKAETEAARTKLTLGNELRDSMLKVAGPYVSDERALKAAQLAPNASPEEVKKAKDDVLEMNYEIRQQLKASGMSNTDIAQHMNYLDDLAIKTPQLYSKALNKGVQTLAGGANIAEQNQPRFERNAAGEFVQVTPQRNQVNPVAGAGTNPNPTTGGVTSTNDYIKDLNARSAVALETDMRLGEAKDLLKTIKGGAGTKNFAEIARIAQAANLPTALVDSIAGGDLSAVQSAQKFITQAVIQSATANPGTAESVNRYIKDNPDIGTDPRALDRFIKFTEKLNNKTFDETQFLLEQKRSGKFNPETHVQETQQHLRQKYLNPESKPESNLSGKSESNISKKVVREYVGPGTGRTVQIFEDGTKGYK